MKCATHDCILSETPKKHLKQPFMWRESSHLGNFLIWSRVEQRKWSTTNQKPVYRRLLQRTFWTNHRWRWPLRHKSTWSSRGTEGKSLRNIHKQWKHTEITANMPKQLPIPTFNWKSSDQIREWDSFEAKAKLWLAGEKVEKELQYTQIVLMLGDESLSRWNKFKLTDEQMKQPVNVFKVFRATAWEKIFHFGQPEQSCTKISVNIKINRLLNWTYGYMLWLMNASSPQMTLLLSSNVISSSTASTTMKWKTGHQNKRKLQMEMEMILSPTLK